MRILFVNYVFSQFRGGGENFDLNLACQYSLNHFNPSFLTVSPINGSIRLVTNEFSIPQHYCYAFYFYDLSFKLKSTYPSLGRIAYVLRLIGQLSFEISAFIWLIFNYKSYARIFVNYLPLLSILCTLFLPRLRVIMRMPGPILSPLDHFLCKRLPFIVSNGNAYKQIQSLGFTNNHFVQVGIDPAFLTPSLYKRDSSISSIRIASVGRLVPIKQHDLLLKLIANSAYKSRCHLNFYGTGPSLDSLQKLASTLTLSSQLSFHGHLDKSALSHQLISANDCLLLLSSYDNYPNCIIEANSLGIPVFAFNVGGISKQIHHLINGYLVDYTPKLSTIANELDTFLALLISGHFHPYKISQMVRDTHSWHHTYQAVQDIYADS